MAKTATLYRFQIELSDIDRGVYETLDLRVAQHPSEDAERLTVRVLARALAHEDGLAFGRGLSNPEDAGLWSHTATGEIGTWIDTGLPSAERLHRASKAAQKLLVFTHKPDTSLRREWRTRKIHRAAAIQVYRFPAKFIEDLAGELTRRMSWHVTIHDGMLSVTLGESNHETALEQISLASLVNDSVT